MKKITILILILSPIFIKAQSNNVQKFINKELKTDSLFCNAVVGIYAENDKGKCVAQWNPDLPLLTASTMKTITTGAAMDILGSDFRYKTVLAWSGEVTDSILNGNIYIIGGGDPTFGAELSLATPVSEIFSKWKNSITALGVKEIKGSIIPDDRYFTREAIPESWSWGNIGESYGSGTSGLCFYENTQVFYISPADSIGAPAIFEGCYPDIPDMNYKWNVTTEKAGSGSSTYYFTSDLSRTGHIYGRIAIDKETVAPTFSNKFPHLSCAEQFISYLKAEGISTDVDIKEVHSISTPYSLNIFPLDTTYSPSLSEIVHETNITSNNLFAETIFKTIGKEVSGVGSYDSAQVVMKSFLASHNITLTGYTQCDGSGLSRQDYISPRFFCNFYKMMLKSNIFARYIESFPVPGMEGSTLVSVLKDEPDEIKERIHAKSGSLSNVRCYAGYVDSKDGPVRFAILVNNYSARTSQMQPKIEEFMKQLSIYAGKRK